MSADTVDDLHEAEDAATALALSASSLLHVVERFLADRPWPGSIGLDVVGIVEDAKARVHEWEQYCRPTCRFLDEGECQDDDPECCGCPCQHDGAAS